MPKKSIMAALATLVSAAQRKDWYAAMSTDECDKIMCVVRYLEVSVAQSRDRLRREEGGAPQPARPVGAMLPSGDNKWQGWPW